MQAAVRVLLTLVVLTSASLLGYDMASYYLYSPWTRDARVRADVVSVAPDVSGYITDLRVHNDQFVHKGDILFVIDQERYRLALADAEATASVRFAQHKMLLHQFERRSKLTVGLSVTSEDLDTAGRQSESAAANYQQSVASRGLAELNLKRTEVRAAVNGFVTNLNLAKGTYASPSKPVLALIDSDSYRVDAYFEETKIPQIRADSPVDIRLMNGAATLQGRVESIARGITDYDNRDGPELLANVNPTFTWVRLAQRIPVRIRLIDVPADVLISAGMTCTVTLKEGAGPHIGAGIKRLMAAIWPASLAMASASAPASGSAIGGRATTSGR
ncbi:MAG: HlyD family secretion protein [Bradyrhizobium sp.]